MVDQNEDHSIQVCKKQDSYNGGVDYFSKVVEFIGNRNRILVLFIIPFRKTGGNLSR